MIGERRNLPTEKALFKKTRKKAKKSLTNGGGFSILTKRSRERVKNWKANGSEAEGFRKVAEKSA